jgi:hypothetical protein
MRRLTSWREPCRGEPWAEEARRAVRTRGTMAYKKLHGGVARDDERGVPCCARGAMAMVVQYTLICRIMCRPCTQFRTFSLNRRRVQYTVVGNSVSSREHAPDGSAALLRICDPTLTLLSGWYAEPRIVFRGSCQCVGCSRKLQSSLPESLLVVTILSMILSRLTVVLVRGYFYQLFSRHFCRTVPLPVVSGRDSVVLVDRT